MFGTRIGTLRAAVDGVVDVDPAAWTDEEIRQDLTGTIAQIDRLLGHVARMAHAGHIRGIGAVDGSSSTAAWLRRNTGLRHGEARGLIDAGDACAGPLAETGRAWRAGEITATAARTIVGARVDGHDLALQAVERSLLGLARDRMDRELVKACDWFRHHATADGTCPRDRDGLSIARTYAGRTYLTADLSEDAAEIVVGAIHHFTDPPAEGDPRTAARRRADALVRMAEVATAAVSPDQTPTRALPSATVVVDWTTLVDAVPGRLDGIHTGLLTMTTVEKLLCDATISRVILGPDSIPIDVGRDTRVVNRAQRRAVTVRDGGCRFPGCHRAPPWCDVHHVTHWIHGGPTNLDNILLLCPYHHHLVHRPGWILKFDGHDAHFIDPMGIEIRGP